MKTPKVFGLHASPGEKLGRILGIAPFVLLVILYLAASQIRHAENPHDKIMPTVTQMADAVKDQAFTKDKRKDSYLMLRDTVDSLTRLLIGLFSASAVGLLLGLNMGLFPGLRHLFHSFVTFFSMIPPLAILPILFIVAGADEGGKIVLIFIGVFPLIARDIFLAVQKIPKEQITKALTLGASELGVTYRVVLPQIMPRLIDSVRLSLGTAWLYLIAAEAISAESGLGYSIFLHRRQLNMDVIIPYVFWITFLGFMMDWILRKLVKHYYPWYAKTKD